MGTSMPCIGSQSKTKAYLQITYFSEAYSLRHSFAINTLNKIKARGESPQHALPVLATYMGHRKYQYTGAYLKVKDAKHRAGLIEFVKSRAVVK